MRSTRVTKNGNSWPSKTLTPTSAKQDAQESDKSKQNSGSSWLRNLGSRWLDRRAKVGGEYEEVGEFNAPVAVNIAFRFAAYVGSKFDGQNQEVGEFDFPALIQVSAGIPISRQTGV